MMHNEQMPQLQDDANVNMEFKQFPLAQTRDTVLFVGNLPFSTPWQDIKDYFRNAGRVRYTYLIADRTGRPKGSALVTMMTPESAENAIRMFHESNFQGRQLIVRKFENGPWPAFVQREMMPPYRVMPQHRMYYGRFNNHHGGMNAAPMNGYYQSAGPMMNGSVGGVGNSYMPSNGMYNQAGSFHVGDSNDDMMDQMNDFSVEQLPKPRSQQTNETGRRLFISNLPFDCNSGALRETFQQIGEVERAEILIGRNGRSKGMGIVVMKTEKEAQKAIDEFDEVEMSNRPMKVTLDRKPFRRIPPLQTYPYAWNYEVSTSPEEEHL